jgi:hypothetical protein
MNPDADYSDAKAEDERAYVFRGDDNYQTGPVGLTLGAEADRADIQNHADRVLHKESSRTSRFVSFTTEIKVARRFTSASDSRNVRNAKLTALRALEARGTIRIWDPDQVYELLNAAGKKLKKLAPDVRAAMKRNCEILIEGQIPEELIETVK